VPAKTSNDKIGAEKSSKLSGKFEVPVGWVKELNFFDITGEKAKTKGTSSKFYHIEIKVYADGNIQLYTEYGPTGTNSPAKEYRHFGKDRTRAEVEFNKIVKSKVKKGYNEIDVAQRAFGSEEAKKQTKAVILKNADDLIKTTSNLNSSQKEIVSLFFNAQDTWVAQTLKCPLGQLSNNQIDLGRAVLDEAKIVVNATKILDKTDLDKIDELTNRFYGLIPHNHGMGARGQMTELRLDSLDKIVGKESDLDTLLDAKQVNAVLKQDSSIDDKYRSLNCDFDEVSVGSDLFRFLSGYFDGSKVSGHGFGSAKVSRIWSMRRKDAKECAFLSNAEKIAKECGKHTFATDAGRLSSGKSKLWTPDNRLDIDNDQKCLFKNANVWLVWHGTRSANLVGITRRGLLIRPTGAAYTGSMMGDGKYFGWQSTKSLNYCDGGYWTGGKRHSSKFMFLLDAAFGNMYHQSTPHFFKKPPTGYHSVYGKAGINLYNDEMVTYDNDDKNNQSSIRFLLEII
jgi:predicted DNA-binding WGR domain protein